MSSSNDTTVTFTPDQLKTIEKLGRAAEQEIQQASAQGQSPPVAIWRGMYDDILSLMNAEGVQGPQAYWFKEAGAINADNLSDPAGYFVRDITSLGFGVPLSDPKIQDISDTIGQSIFETIEGNIKNGSSSLSFSEQLQADIGTAISTFGLPVGSWGGSFYFWNFVFDRATGVTIGQTIESDQQQRQTFIKNTAQAMSDTIETFGLSTLRSQEASREAFAQGMENLVFAGPQGWSIAYSLVQQLASDVGAAVTRQFLDLINFGWMAETAIAEGSGTVTGGSGSDLLVGGQGLGGVGNDTLVGGSGDDSFVFALPASGSATETISDAIGNGQVAVLNASGEITLLGGTEEQPLAAVAGESNTWTDSQGTLYTFDAVSGDLKITDGSLGNGNEILIEGFNLGAATSSTANGGSDVGYLGFHLSDEITLTAGATVGVNPSAPNFTTGSTQSYTVSVAAPSSAAQTVTISLTGVPASDFGLVLGTSVIPIGNNGTFTVTIPVGQTSASFSLTNTNDVGSAASLQLVASMPDPSDPSGDSVSSTALTQNYVEPNPDPFSVPPTDTLYFQGTATTSGGLAYNSYDAVDGAVLSPTAVGGAGNGNNYIFVSGEPNSSVNGGTGNDTIFTQFGFKQADGGVDVINGDGGQDDILGSGEALDGQATIRIYANHETDLASAIADASTEAPTGEKGDLIVTADPGTVVGGNGNDLILSSDGGVIVAGPGNDTIAVGAPILYTAPDWTGNSSTPSPGPHGVTWSTSLSNGSLEVNGGSITLGRIGDGAPPTGYEGNFDDTGGIFATTNDTIFGGSGNDLIYLSNGNDEVHLGSGDSTVNGGMGSDSIFGGSGSDCIIGGGGSDYITAGSGNDLIMGRGGNNTIFGGSGSDTLSAGGATNDSTPEETGNNYVQAGTGNTFIFGSGGNDTLIGGSGTDTIQAGKGNESIVAGWGATSIIGGDGPDTIVAGSGSDTIWGSTRSTTIYGGSGTDFISGRGGKDVIYAGDGGTAQSATTIKAGSGDTTIYGGEGVDQISGGSGNDVIYAGDGGTANAPTQIMVGSGDTTVYGGDGFDNIVGGSGSNVLYAGDGGDNENPTSVTAGTGFATLIGGAGASVLTDNDGGNDLLEAGSGDATLVGTGQDTLIAGSGIDYLAGGDSSTYVFGSDVGVDEVANDGTETLEFASSVDLSNFSMSAAIGADGAGALTIDEGEGSITVDGGLSGADVAAIEFDGSQSISLAQLLHQEAGLGNIVAQTLTEASGNLIFDGTEGGSISAGPGEDTISAWGDNDTLSASSGGTQIIAGGMNDSVTGGTGNDVLDAEAAGTTLVGGMGSEVFEVNDATDVIEAQAEAISNQIYSSVSYTLPINVSVLTLTGTADLSATGNSDAANLITGNDGNDTLIAGSGADTLVSGSGTDTLVGGSGRDTFIVNNSADEIDVSAPNGGNDTVLSSVDYVLSAPVSTLRLTGFDDLSATDGYGYATIIGNAGNDTLIGAAGSDTLVAGTGIDTLVAGSGTTVFVVNNSSDVIQVIGPTGSDTVESSVNYTLSKGVDTLELTGGANLQAVGNSDASNEIIANSGSDTLIAGSGNDTLVAGTGTDFLEGGTGTTTYLLNAGFGQAEIEGASSRDTVEFGSGITPSDLTVGLAIDSSGDPALLIQDGNSTATVDGGLTGSVSDFEFADGTKLTLSELLTSATVAPGSIAGFSGNAILDASTGASLSGSGNDTIVGTGASDTLVGGAGDEYLLVAGGESSISGGFGNDTLVGGGTQDTVAAGNGNQQLYAFGTGDVLAGGMGDDTLHGGVGSDTLIAGIGSTAMYGGAGTDSIVLAAGATTAFYPSSTGGLELIELPGGMTLADFTSYRGAGGDLILQSISGGTTAVIKGFYGGGAGGKLWMIADGTGSAQLLSQWLGSNQPPPPSGYEQEMDQLRQAFGISLVTELNQIGQHGGTIPQPLRTPANAPGDEYQFNGVTSQDVLVQGGSATLASSADDQRTFTNLQTGSTTERVTTPVYGEAFVPGWQTFIPDILVGPEVVEDMENQPSNNGNGFSIERGTDSFGNSGFFVTEIPFFTYGQTGTKTTTVTVPEYTTFSQETEKFISYNVVGDGGDDVISAGPWIFNQFGQNIGPYFTGTVMTGDGNVSVDLGMNNWYRPLGASGTWNAGDPLSPGAFIEAGSGNDTIGGTGGADVIAAGMGFDDITAAFGSTVYVPLQGASTETIDIVGPFYGNGAVPASTLVLPDGVTAGDLTFRVFSGRGTLDQYDRPMETLQIAYGDSSVLMDFFPENATDTHDETSGRGDDINGIDRLQFSDGTILTRDQVLALAGAVTSVSNLNPVVTPNVTSVDAESVLRGEDLFTASDDSSPITWYQMSSAGTNGGYFVLAGTVQRPGKTFYVSKDQLTSLMYVAGAADTADTIKVAAFDGVVWGATESFDVPVSSLAVYRATASNEEVTGASIGPDTLIGGFGGDTLIGSSGKDTFEYNTGGGAEVISDTAPASSTADNVVQFGSGITPSSMSLSASGDPQLVLSIGSAGDTLTIEGFDPLNPLQSFPIQSFAFADGSKLSLLQLLGDDEISGSSGSITNADGSVTRFTFTPSGQQIYYAQTDSAAGPVLEKLYLDNDGSQEADSFVYNADGTRVVTRVVTAAAGGSTTTVDGFDASGNEVSEHISNPDGSSSFETWDTQGRRLIYDVTSADGSTSDQSVTWNADGSSTFTTVTTPSGGGGSTTRVDGFDTLRNEVSEQISNPDGSSSSETWDTQGRRLTYDVTSADGSTSDQSVTWNADGSSIFTTVVTPTGGGGSTTTVDGFDALRNEVSEQISNPDGSNSSETWDTQGRRLTYDVTSADGSTSDQTVIWNTDGSNTSTTVTTPAGGGGSTTTVDGFDASGHEVSEQISNPDGSSSFETWDTQNRRLTYDATSADGSTSDESVTWNADGSRTDTTVTTPAGGGSTTTVVGLDASGNQVSEQISNPDGSSSSQTWDTQGRTLTLDATHVDGSTDSWAYVYNADGTYTGTEVSTPAGGGESNTSVHQYDAQGNQQSENSYAPTADGSYSDSWSKVDGSHGSYWWNASTAEYQEAWVDSNGSSWSDDYKYAVGGSPGTTGYSFVETYSASDGSHGTRQFDASTGTSSITWDSTATGSLSGTATDSGFIGLQHDAELTNTQADPTFFNPSASPSFNAFLAAH